MGKKNPLGLTNAFTFFREWTPDMAYVLGLLFADGCITTRKGRYAEVVLEMKDVEHLRAVASAIDPKLVVREYERADGRRSAKISCGIEQIIVDCVAVGLVPAKTATLQWSSALPRQLEADFVRGYFDGDGCIHLQKPTDKITPGNHNKLLSFACGSSAFAQALSEVILYHTHEMAGSNLHMPNCTTIYYRRKSAIRNVGEWMYSGSSNLRLERKYVRWLEVCAAFGMDAHQV